ncbi:hypothetical protein M0R04_04865 [Candidatus Dojkabacteria bacterium]|jgi:DNA-directed RNA polymerase subunit RPC12/RpoP|nr:hypothetical protein [Candidatus Dojkabacteria bacterium]
MADRILYCAGCSTKVAIIFEGSRIKRGTVVLCSYCEDKRKMSDLANKTSPQFNYSDMFKDMFGGLKK